MNDLRLTDAQFTARLKAIAPAQAQAGLRVQILAEVEAIAQERRLPGLLGRLTDANPKARRRAMLLVAAALLALGLATAGVVGALLQEQVDPLEGVDLTPPTDLAAFARSAYENMPLLPPLTLTALQDGTTMRRIYVGAATVRIETYASPDATELDGYEIYTRNGRAQLVTLGSERHWVVNPTAPIGQDPREFVFSAMQCCMVRKGAPPPPLLEAGCEVATHQGEEYVGEPGRDWTYVGVEIIAARPAHHVTCGGRDLWLDIETRLILRDRSAAGTNEVVELAFGQPAAELFDLGPPEGVAAISADEFFCSINLACTATPGPVPTMRPDPDGGEPPADLEALVAAARAADDSLPAYEVAIAWTNTTRPGSDRTQIHHDGAGRYRFEWTSNGSLDPESIWLVGPEYSYRSRTTTDGAGVFWLQQRPPSRGGVGGSYPLKLLEECAGGWEYLGSDLILDRPAEHVGCPGDLGLTEFWIDRETSLVLRVMTPFDPETGTDVEEVVELRFVDPAPEVFELPDGADLR